MLRKIRLILINEPSAESVAYALQWGRGCPTSEATSYGRGCVRHWKEEEEKEGWLLFEVDLVKIPTEEHQRATFNGLNSNLVLNEILLLLSLISSSESKADIYYI